MSKAEERALERFPVHEGASKKWIESHLKSICSDYIEGYHQAEKDLELTWKDIESIHTLMAHQEVAPILWKCGNEAFYQEVLKRFKDLKERKNE